MVIKLLDQPPRHHPLHTMLIGAAFTSTASANQSGSTSAKACAGLLQHPV